MQNSTESTNKFDAWLGTFLRVVSMSCLTVISILMVFNVFTRFFPIFSMSWFDEILEGVFAWMVFMGAAALAAARLRATLSTYEPDVTRRDPLLRRSRGDGSGLGCGAARGATPVGLRHRAPQVLRGGCARRRPRTQTGRSPGNRR